MEIFFHPPTFLFIFNFVADLYFKYYFTVRLDGVDAQYILIILELFTFQHDSTVETWRDKLIRFKALIFDLLAKKESRKLVEKTVLIAIKRDVRIWDVYIAI